MNSKLINRRKSLKYQRYNQHFNQTAKSSFQPQSLQKVKYNLQIPNIYEIYFDNTKKSNYIKNIVQNYFNQQDPRQYHRKVQNFTNRTQKIQRSSQFKKKNLFKLKNLINNGPITTAKKIQLFEDNLQQNNDSNEQQVKINKTLSQFIYPQSRKLPPITQIQDKQQQNIIESNQKIMGFDLQSKIKTYENDIFLIYTVYQNNKPVYRLKEYKQIGLQIIKRQSYINKYQISTIWKQHIQSRIHLISPLVLPIKNHLCKITSFQQNNQVLYKIMPKPYYTRLLSDSNIQLINFIRDVCLTLKKVQNKVINNKINPSNIFLINSKPIIAEWGYSYFRKQHTFDNPLHPILKSKNQWFVSPEYLSPELLQALTSSLQNKQQQINQQFDTKSDIWSLGCTIFEMVTLIPLWCINKCLIKGKENNSRKGLMGVQGRNLRLIKERQKKMQGIMKKCLLSELQSKQLSQNLILLILRMVEFDKNDRISLNELIQKLK